MIIGEIRIDTTWDASTSFIPFPPGSPNAQNFNYGGVANRGIYATTAYVSGIWERNLWEAGWVSDQLSNPTKHARDPAFNDPYGATKSLRGMIFDGQGDVANAFDEGTNVEVKVRKIKALKASPNKSGVQVNRRLVQGNKLVFRYIGRGEMTRPL